VYLYTIALFISVFAFGLKSATVTLLFLVPLEFLMRDVRDPLLHFARLNYEYKDLIWYPFWILCDLLYLFLLRVAHKEFNLQPTKLYQMFAFSYLCFAFIQLVGMLDSMFLRSHYLDLFYSYSIQAINFGLFVYAVYYVVRYAIFDKNINNAV